MNGPNETVNETDSKGVEDKPNFSVNFQNKEANYVRLNASNIYCYMDGTIPTYQFMNELKDKEYDRDKLEILNQVYYPYNQSKKLFSKNKDIERKMKRNLKQFINKRLNLLLNNNLYHVNIIIKELGHDNLSHSYVMYINYMDYDDDKYEYKIDWSIQYNINTISDNTYDLFFNGMVGGRKYYSTQRESYPKFSVIEILNIFRYLVPSDTNLKEMRINFYD